MKKTMIAALASLMLAGMLGAITGMCSYDTAGTIAVIGNGFAPPPVSLPSAAVQPGLPPTVNTY